jgi:hypothetical protein
VADRPSRIERKSKFISFYEWVIARFGGRLGSFPIYSSGVNGRARRERRRPPALLKKQTTLFSTWQEIVDFPENTSYGWHSKLRPRMVQGRRRS